jgi:hypothetical protein
LYCGRLTYRRLLVLLSHLPPDSAVGRALGGDAVGWTIEHELLATLVDVANVHRWQHARVHFKGVSGQPPERVPRPHRPNHERPRRRHMTVEEMAAMFGRELKPGWDEQEEGDADGD